MYTYSHSYPEMLAHTCIYMYTIYTLLICTHTRIDTLEPIPYGLAL